MAIAANIRVMLEVTGLESALEMMKKFSTATAPTAVTHQRRTIAAANTAEALDLGDIATVELILIKAVSKDMEIDCDWDTAFNADLLVHEGELALFKPIGVVYVENETADEALEYEYIVIGTT